MARYALVIGIDTNIAPLKSLSKTAGDARAIADLFDRQGGFVSVKRLIGAVTQAQLEGALQALLTQQAERNEVVIYYTGHGFPLVESFGGQRVYLAAADCQVTVRDGQVVGQQRGTSLEGLNNLFRSANLSNLVVLLECCYGGGFLENSLVRETMTAFTKTDYFLIAACRDFEQAYALKAEAHSIFTTALLAGLRDGNDRGQVTTGRLFDSIYGALQESGQEPIALGSGRSLTLVSYQQKSTAHTAPIPIDDTNPYQSLLAFTKETAKFFFGRDRVVQDLIGKLQNSNFVPLIGASGSGKSSVVRAGVVPRLEDLGWRVLEPIVPGVDPIENLRSATLDLNELTDQKILLVIDQFEEIFTLSRDRKVQSAFIQELMALSEKVAIVVTMRVDFVEACLADEALTQSIQRNAIYLGAMTGKELEDAIVNPAEKQGVKLQERLLARILKDVESEENCLPLLEFTLSQLWEKRPKAEIELSVANYEALGGVMGSLNTHAEEIYQGLVKQKREDWVQQVMLKLVRTGEGKKDTRQRQLKADLLGLGKNEQERDAIESVIMTLVDGRLLVGDRVNDQDVIDLSHEALMLSWKRFVGWREDDREIRRLVDKIEDAKREWQTQKKREYLLDGRLLKDARRLLKDKPNVVLGAKAFIQKSSWWGRSQMAGLLVIPILVLGIPLEYFLREESVKRDYDRLALCSNKVRKMSCQDAIMSLVRGCRWRGSSPSIQDKTVYYGLEKAIAYPTERIFGNCRRLDQVNLRDSYLPSANLNNSFLESIDLSDSNLSGAKLRNVNLTSARLISIDLRNANLNDSFLHSIDLSNSKLNGAELRKVNLDKARLINTDFTGANLNNGFLHSVDLSNSKLNGAELRSVNLTSARLINTDFTGANLNDSFLHSVDLSNSKLNNAELRKVNLDSARLINADFTGANLNDGFLHSGNFSKARMIGTQLLNTNFDKANLTDTILNGANMSSSFMVKANLSGASLIGANLSNVNFDDANLQGVQFGCLDSKDLKTRKCSDLTGIKWNEKTNFRNIRGWEYVQNIPSELSLKIKRENRE